MRPDFGSDRLPGADDGVRVGSWRLGGGSRVRHRGKRRKKHQHRDSPQNCDGSMPQVNIGNEGLFDQWWRAEPTSARIIPRTALISRVDHPALVKIVRSVFLVACVRDGGWK